MIVNDLPQQASNELEIANLYLLKEQLLLIQQNLNLLLAGDQGKTITVTGTNLFTLAAEYYGDATFWNVIAQANQNSIKDVNGFIDTNISGAVTLIIPPKPTAPTGGIYSA